MEEKVNFGLPAHLDVAELGPTAVRRRQGGGELDLFGQLTPLPAVRLGALDLTEKRQHLRWAVNSSKLNAHFLLVPSTAAAGRP